MTLHGIDISHWQSGLQLAKTDAQFALFKATDGTSYVDACCDGFVSQAKKAGIPWGVYHFWQGNPTAEADHFVDSVAGYIGHGILVLDFEGAHAVSAAAAKTFLDRVYERTGVRPLIYMSQSVTRQFDWSAVAKDYALWVARYGSSSYGDTGAWKSPVMWQYTDAHKTGGYSVDGDYFYGDRSTWAAFADAAGSTPAPDPNPQPDTHHDEDDAMTYHGFSTKKPLKLTAEKWATLRINDDGDESLISGTGPFHALVQVTADGLPAGHQLAVRYKLVDTKSGADTKRHSTYPSTEIVGTGGATEGQAAQYGTVPAASSGWQRRLRVEVMTYDDGVTLTSVQARAFQ